jgi:hypothetical protein
VFRQRAEQLNKQYINRQLAKESKQYKDLSQLVVSAMPPKKAKASKSTRKEHKRPHTSPVKAHKEMRRFIKAGDTPYRRDYTINRNAKFKVSIRKDGQVFKESGQDLLMTLGDCKDAEGKTLLGSFGDGFLVHPKSISGSRLSFHAQLYQLYRFTKFSVKFIPSLPEGNDTNGSSAGWYDEDPTEVLETTAIDNIKAGLTHKGFRSNTYIKPKSWVMPKNTQKEWYKMKIPDSPTDADMRQVYQGIFRLVSLAASTTTTSKGHLMAYWTIECSKPHMHVESSLSAPTLKRVELEGGACAAGDITTMDSGFVNDDPYTGTIESSYTLDETKTNAVFMFRACDTKADPDLTYTFKPGDVVMLEIVAGCDTSFPAGMSMDVPDDDKWTAFQPESSYSVYTAYSNSLLKTVAIAVCITETDWFRMRLNCDLDIPDISNSVWRALCSPGTPSTLAYKRKQAQQAAQETKLIAAEIKQRLARAKVTARQKLSARAELLNKPLIDGDQRGLQAAVRTVSERADVKLELSPRPKGLIRPIDQVGQSRRAISDLRDGVASHDFVFVLKDPTEGRATAGAGDNTQRPDHERDRGTSAPRSRPSSIKGSSG